MAYDKQTWDTTSYVNPTRMNHIEDGIANAMTNDNMGYLGAKNLNIYPYYETSHTDHNVVWTDNGDGTVVANGKATSGNGNFNCHSHNATNELYQLILPNGNYIVSGCPTGGSLSTYYIQIGYYDTTGNFAVLDRDLGEGVEITLNGDYYSTDSVRLNITCRVYNNYTADNLVWKPMIRLAGDNDNTWRPYTMTNSELADKRLSFEQGDRIEAGDWNLLRQPYYHTTQTMSGVDFTINADGSVTADGTASSTGGNVSYNLKRYNESQYHLPKGTYFLSGCPSGGQLSTYRMRVGVSPDTSTSPSYPYPDDFGNGAFFTITDESVYLQVIIVIIAGVTVENLTFHPRIVPAKFPSCDKTTAGTYTLQCTVDASGYKTYSWV